METFVCPCGRTFEQHWRGRPRKYCEECSPPKRLRSPRPAPKVKPPLTCVTCGVEVERQRTGPASRRCPPCKSEHRAALAHQSYERRAKVFGPLGAVCVCRICGGEFVAATKRFTTCDAAECRRARRDQVKQDSLQRNADEGVLCHCGRPVSTMGMCHTHYSASRRATVGRQEKPKTLSCAGCGADVIKASSGRKDRRPVCSDMCRYFVQHGRWQSQPWAPPGSVRRSEAERRQQRAARGSIGYTWYSGRCRECGDWFTTRQSNCETCSDRCSSKAYRSRRRARKRDAFVAPVYRLAIYERDRWTCQLCGKKLKRSAVVPHPLAPTIDHIIPLSIGGTHEPANCQAAHFRCNALKAARGGGEQLLLIG